MSYVVEFDNQTSLQVSMRGTENGVTFSGTVQGMVSMAHALGYDVIEQTSIPFMADFDAANMTIFNDRAPGKPRGFIEVSDGRGALTTWATVE